MPDQRTTDEIEAELQAHPDPGPERDALYAEYMAQMPEPEGLDPFARLTKHSDAMEIIQALERYRDETQGEHLALRTNAVRVLQSLDVPSPGKVADSVFKKAPVRRLRNAKEGEAVLPGYGPSLANCCRVLEAVNLRELVLGPGRLRWNELLKCPEFNSQEIDRSFNAHFRLECERKVFGFDEKTGDKRVIQFGRDTAEDALLTIAKRDSYHPVREYLEALPLATPGAIAMACTDALGLSDELSHVLWRKWLIGAVARVMKPGCQLDTVLVLVAPGGEGKSSAFRALGGEWFSDTHLDMTFKRENSYMQLHRCHIYEIPELEGVHTEKERSRQKSFISSRSDDFRAPYDAVVHSHPRSVALGASTNSRGFMASDDPAFNRRLWPLEIKGSIDVEMLAKLRDQIWSEALAAYRAGEPWHLGDSYQQQLDSLRQRHEELTERDAREPIVAAYLEDPRRATKAILMGDVMRVGLHLQPAQMADLRIQAGVKALLVSLGWESWYRRWDRSKTTRWVKGPIRGHGRMGALPAAPMLEPPEMRDEP